MKKLLNNPIGMLACKDSPQVQKELETLRAKLAAAQLAISRSVVEVPVDNPILIDKIKKLKQELSDLKERGAYKLVQELSRPNTELLAAQKQSTRGEWLKMGIAFAVGLSLGLLLLR